jgi:hypothetical protein
MKTTLVMAALALALVAAPGAAVQSPSPIAWTDFGTVTGAEGTFTAGAPLCPSGTTRQVGGLVGIKIRHTCADGSGEFDFGSSGLGNRWWLSAGTGRYSTLRGYGVCRLTLNDDGTFVRPCEAVADFDNVPPTASIERLVASRAGRGHLVQMTFSTADNVTGNAVSYRADILALGRRIGRKDGTSAGGTTSIELKVRPPKRARRLTVVVRVTDPLGNARSVSRSARLRH